MMGIEWLKPAVFFGSLLFALVGVFVFWLCFIIIDKLTPYDLWAEIVEKKNTALAIVVAQAADRNVTISIGIATFNPDFDTFDADVMVRRADDALYRAKREGRDRAELFDSKRPDLITELRDP